MTSGQRLVILGDSHTQPLARALSDWSFLDAVGADCVFAATVDSGLIAQDLLFETKDRGDQFNPLLQRALEHHGLMNRFVGQYLPEGAMVGLLFGYADPHILGLMKLFFDGFDEGLLRDGPGALSGASHYAMLRAFTRGRLRKVEKTIALLRVAGFSVCLLSGPPPSTDAVLAEQQPAVDPPPSGTRRAVWQAIQEVMAELAPLYGATLLTDQSSFTDDQGFLRPEYVSDGIHANAEHGLAYLTQVCAGLGLPSTAAPRNTRPAPAEVIAPEPATAASTRLPGLARSVVQVFSRRRDGKRE